MSTVVRLLRRTCLGCGRFDPYLEPVRVQPSPRPAGLEAATRTRGGGIRRRMLAAVNWEPSTHNSFRFLLPGQIQYCRLGRVAYNFVGRIRRLCGKAPHER
jgi:hypothetical protein